MIKPRIGIAGWNIPSAYKDRFPDEGSHLEKYAQVFNCVELNSCFYREHKPDTYRRWAESVPEDFLFSLKLLRYFTQEKRLAETGPELKRILDGHAQLGKKWGSFLIQLPPSLAFEEKVVDKFLGAVRRQYDGLIFCEPRHRSWATSEALATLARHNVSKVIADPEPCPLPPKLSKKPPQNLYLRMHGSPEIYKSLYSSEVIIDLQQQMKQRLNKGHQAWCIFDNTTFGYSIDNGLDLQSRMSEANARGLFQPRRDAEAGR